MLSYVLNGYPVLSQTFIRNEILSLRRAGYTVEVDTLGGGDRRTIPEEWSGPYRAMTDTGYGRALLDGMWWLHRPRAVLRLLRAMHACSWDDLRPVVRGVPTAARRLADRDVLVCHTHFGWRATVPTLYVAALLGVPASITVHAADIFMPSPSLGRRLKRMAKVITVCRANIDYVTALGVDREDVQVVPCGVDVDVPLAPVRDPSRLVSVGRLVAKKGFDVLLEAFARVAPRFPDATLEIVGDGPQRELLERMVSDLGLADRVHLLGALPNDSVLQRVVDGGAFVLACQRQANGDSDAMPVSIREAMARERAVISTDIAGIPESVDAEVGWLVPSADVEGLASAMAEALSDPAEARRRGLAGRRRVLKAFSAEASVRALEEVWSDLATARPSHHRAGASVPAESS